MLESGAFTFSDADSYAAAFADARVDLTITGAGDFKATLVHVKFKNLEIYRCGESLPRIAYISLLPERVFLSFPTNTKPPVFGGFVLRNGDIVFHRRGEHVHQRSKTECQWGLISLSAERLANSGMALNGWPTAPPKVSRVLRPAHADALRFQHLFQQACRLGETRGLIERPEVARAMEEEMIHAIVHCLSATETDDNIRVRSQHAAVIVRLEEALSKRIDQKLSMPKLCAELGVPERTLRMFCAEFLGVSPTRYLLLRRLNKARSALRRADPSTATVAEVARNHQFLELGRFAVTYRTTFGESPSTTLQRGPHN
jgi:AraC-like DNA-binding protein